MSTKGFLRGLGLPRELGHALGRAREIQVRLPDRQGACSLPESLPMQSCGTQRAAAQTGRLWCAWAQGILSTASAAISCTRGLAEALG